MVEKQSKMVVHEIKLDKKLNKIIKKHSKKNNLKIETVITNALENIFQNGKKNQTNYVMLREQLYMELLLLENRRIMLESKILKTPNHDKLMDESKDEMNSVNKKLKVVEEIMRENGGMNESGILLQ